MQSTSEEEQTLREFGTRLAGVDYIERPGVYAVIENNHKQIAVIETRTGYFLPGGGIDPGETEMDALKREIKEEIGYQVSALVEIGGAVEYIKAQAEGKYYQIHGKFYKVQVGSKIGEGTEEDHRLVWLSQGDASKLLMRQSQVWAVQRLATEY
ncbi:MAG TPA: NUDIX domain-containing protein [Anaerolineales bacterium]|nr:NUDIX domain-containing protein [Anaerolineales bacterium]